MITRLPSPAKLAISIVFVFASVLLMLFVWRSVGGAVPLEPQRYQVKVVFDNASQLTTNADVRISGVNVGKVVKIRPDGLLTEATLSIKPEFSPLAGDTKAILRLKTLLGETFVTLTPGTRAGPELADGDSIPARRVGKTQPLDRVLEVFDEPTRKRFTELLVDTNTTFEDRSEEMNDAFGNFAVGTRQLAAVIDILDSQRGHIGTILRDGGSVARTFGDEEAAVRELVVQGNSALSATGDRDQALAATIDALPPFMRELRAGSARVAVSAKRARPTLRAFKPVAPHVEPALESVRVTAPQVSAVLRGMERMLPLALKGLPAATRFQNGLKPLTEALDPLAREVQPASNYLEAYKEELVATMGNVAASTKGSSQGTDGIQTRYMRTLLPINADALVDQSSRQPNNRHNAYREPGGYRDLLGGLTASSCANAGSSPIPAPACKVQGGWSFNGGPSRYFQRIEPATP